MLAKRMYKYGKPSEANKRVNVGAIEGKQVKPAYQVHKIEIEDEDLDLGSLDEAYIDELLAEPEPLPSNANAVVADPKQEVPHDQGEE